MRLQKWLAASEALRELGRRLVVQEGTGSRFGHDSQAGSQPFLELHMASWIFTDLQIDV